MTTDPIINCLGERVLGQLQPLQSAGFRVEHVPNSVSDYTIELIPDRPHLSHLLTHLWVQHGQVNLYCCTGSCKCAWRLDCDQPHRHAAFYNRVQSVELAQPDLLPELDRLVDRLRQQIAVWGPGVELTA